MAKFEALPPEVIILIAEFLAAAKGKLSPLAALCRQFQPHIEGLIWRRLRIADVEVADFVRLVNPSRFLLVRRLTYQIDLTPTDRDRHASSALSHLIRPTPTICTSLTLCELF